MFILSVRYTRPIEEVDALLDAHRDWLMHHKAAGIFLAGGREVPRTGGVILARGERAAVEALAQTDPFVLGGVAETSVTEFVPLFVADGLELLQT